MRRSGTQVLVSILDGQPIPKIPAFIVDVDGTVAIRGERGIYQFEYAGLDIPNTPVVEMVNRLAEWGQERILFVTGRSEKYRAITEEWLQRYITVYDGLAMRNANDQRPDWMVKSDIFIKMIEPTYDIKGVFDDRQTVVDMWRRFGLTCYQVAPGNF